MPLLRICPQPARDSLKSDNYGVITITIRQSRVVDVLDVRGRLLRQVLVAKHPAGFHSVFWNGRSTTGGLASSGRYFPRITTPKRIATEKMTLIK